MELEEDSFVSMIQQSIGVPNTEIVSKIGDTSSANIAVSVKSLANIKSFDSDCADNISPVEPVERDHVEIF